MFKDEKNIEENKKNENKSKINFNLIKKSFPEKKYHIHSDIDLWINITLMEILNYENLLGDKLSFIKSEKKYNYSEIEENVNNEKLEILTKLSEGNINEKSKNKKNTILGYETPDCELYFIVKLFVDDMERKPSYQTKIIFNTKNINQCISFKYKYKDLTEESYIIIEIYSVQLKQEDSFLGKAKLFLFDKNLNLYQGRHSIKINKNLEDNNEKEIYTEIENEIDILINSFYGKEYENSENYYGEGNNKDGIKIKDSKIKIEEIKNNYYYNLESKEPQLKTDLMKHYEKKLKELLGKTNSSFIIIRTPSFNYQVIYEEEISENFQEYLKFNDKGEEKIWINDGNIYVGKDFEDKDNPVTKKFYLLSKYNQGDLAKEVKMTPEDREIIEKRLNIPDFLDLENDKEVFWKNRYELKRDCTPNALTKILNAVNWNEKQNYDEFFKNILYDWKNIEMCDILYILSRKFSVNNYFRDDNKIKNFVGLKKLRKYAVHLLKNFSIKDLNFILLQLVQAIKYEDISNKSFYSPLVKLLFEKSKSDLIFASSFYWFIECESSDGELAPIFSKIKEFFLKEMEDNKLFINIIKNEIEFKSELEEISKIVKNTGTKDQKRKLLEIIDKEKKNFMHNEEHCLPIDPKIRIKGIFSQDCTVFGSAQRPIKYTFKMTPETKKNNRLGENIYYRLIYKSGDDLRQDQLILQMINFMDSLLKKYIDCEFTIYKVLATSKSDGFVEFVPESITYFDIIKKYKKLKFYFKDNIDNSVEYKNKLNKFVNSLAGYCAVNYILGIGDRHNQNIMFRKSGHLFHIDFGYIFGKEPNWLNPIRFKVSQDMIEFMGGKDSEMYKKFINKCVNAYLELRKNARTIINMFYLMIDSGIQQLKDIESLNKLHEQFAPGLTVDEAQEKFLKDYEDSLNSKTSEIREKFHEWKQDFL